MFVCHILSSRLQAPQICPSSENFRFLFPFSFNKYIEKYTSTNAGVPVLRCVCVCVKGLTNTNQR